MRDAKRLSKAIRAHSIDILHVQVVGDAEGALAGRLAGVRRVVGTYHMNTREDRGHRRLPERLTAMCLDQAIAVSDSTRNQWRERLGLRPDKISVIPNGVEVPSGPGPEDRGAMLQSLGVPSDAGPILVTVGRLAEQKGHRYLLRAVTTLLADFPKLQLLLVGDGILRDDLQAEADRQGLACRVKFLGHRSDVRAVLQVSDLFVLPSLWEAMPFALLEAMASGIPVIATDVAGVPELVQSGVTGMLVPPADSDAIAGAIRAIREMPDRGKSLAEAALTLIRDRYSYAAMLAQTSDLYRRLTDCRRLGPSGTT